MADGGFDPGRQWLVTFAAEQEPNTICPALDFLSAGDEFFNRPAFGRAIFRAGIQAEDRPVDVLQPELFLRRFHFRRGHRQLWRERFGICTERGGQVEIFKNLVRRRIYDLRFTIYD